MRSRAKNMRRRMGPGVPEVDRAKAKVRQRLEATRPLATSASTDGGKSTTGRAAAIRCVSAHFVISYVGKENRNKMSDRCRYLRMWHHLIQKLEFFLEMNAPKQIQKIRACVVRYKSGSKQQRQTDCLFSFSPVP